MRVQVSLDEKLVEIIDNYADANSMTRSGLISLATNQYLTREKVSYLEQQVMARYFYCALKEYLKKENN